MRAIDKKKIWDRGMRAVGENCVTTIQFEISSFYSSGGQAPAQQQKILRWGPGPPQIFSGGGGF